MPIFKSKNRFLFYSIGYVLAIIYYSYHLWQDIVQQNTGAIIYRIAFIILFAFAAIVYLNTYKNAKP